MGVCWSSEDQSKGFEANQEKDSPKSNGISLLTPPKDVEDLRLNAGNGNVYIFTYSELTAATKTFRPDQILGEGGFGIVYKGIIDDNIRSGFNSIDVAVKELNREGFQGDKEWLTEVNYLGQLSHPNLVRLIGYCCEGEHRLLVYEYMPCGSLEKHLFQRFTFTMTWSTRMKIALGAANGLAFLHSAERPIIYRDFKTSNILLDAEYNAKLSDFGLAKEGPVGDQTHVSTRVMGTHGYAAPEYVMTGHLTARSDVYGFGVMLLELLIGRRVVDMSKQGREHNLVEWTRPLLIHSRKLFKIIDPRVEGQYSDNVATEFAGLAHRCLSKNPKGRPTMSEVVKTLEGLWDLPERKDGILFQDLGGAVTLYEAPKKSVYDNSFSKSDGTDESEVESKRGRSGNGESKSEPPAQYTISSPSGPDESLPDVKTTAGDHRAANSIVSETYDM